MNIFKKTVHASALMLILSSTILSTVANAQQKRQHRGPPPEAIDACVSQVEEAVCGFSGPRGDVSGTCSVSPQGQDQLICSPQGSPPQKQ